MYNSVVENFDSALPDCVIAYRFRPPIEDVRTVIVRAGN
jgi:hypothetical protein